ncbi:hypothetical protein [Ensifer aridi]|uniref:hypothetical protein n=1 Tax=Ensifer aridi TaxID=1708715 RepID=UPI001FCCC59E|nr:hypothetical protein [Ensifer aridi]
MSALREYLEARRKAKAPQSPDSGLFWHDQGNARYTSHAIAWCLVDILRRAAIKPPKGKIGPRIHDLRHSFVVNRILEWYRAGINPQDTLPFLATYLGHRDIHSTLVYITVTQEGPLSDVGADRLLSLQSAPSCTIPSRNAETRSARATSACRHCAASSASLLAASRPPSHSAPKSCTFR